MELSFEHKTIDANGLEFAYFEMGEGPLALLFHGFPDVADAWLDFMPKLAAAGYRVVAPFMRGYFPTDIPANNRYSAIDLAQDVIGLIDAFGYETATIIGHDWGALTVYSAANLAPERIERVVAVAVPHPRSIKPSLGFLIKARHFFTFLNVSATVRWLERNQFAGVREIYRRWSPTWDVSDAELEPLFASFRQPGVTRAAVSYYTSLAADQRSLKARKISTGKTSVPTFYIAGAADGALDASNLEVTRKAFTGPYQYAVMEGVGHFPHREAPEQFAQLVLDYLRA